MGSAEMGEPHEGTVKSAMVGVVLGVDGAGHCLALATLCLAGGLSVGLGLATTLFALSSVIGTLALIWRSGFRLSFAVAQDTTIAVLAPAIAFAAASAAGGEATQLGTAFAVIGVSALASGAAFWLVGRFGLGQLVRMFPYPVAAGFLASSGYLLVFAALTISLEPLGVSALFLGSDMAETARRLAPMLAMTLCLFLGMRFLSGSASVILVIGAFVTGFYLWLWLSGLQTSDAVALHLLPKVSTGFGHLDFAAMWVGIDWHAVALTAPTLAAVVLLNLLGMLLNTAGVELSTGETVDVNRELQVTGQANLLIGAFGGLTSFLQGGATILANKLGVARGPFLAGHVGTLLLAAVLAGPMVAAVPIFVPAGLLMFIGVSMLWDWLIVTYRRLMPMDWAIVLGIVGLTVFFGILPAILIGILLAIFSFAVTYARLPVVRFATHGAARFSIRDRDPAARAHLAEAGLRIRILHLQGALFFGSVEQLTTEVRRLHADVPDLHSVILDLRGVHSFDSSACAALVKLGRISEAAGVAVWLVDMAPQLAEVLRRWGMDLKAHPTGHGLQWAATLDDALETAEDALLAGSEAETQVKGVGDILNLLSDSHPKAGALAAMMDRLELAADTVLIRSDEASQDVYFLVQGQLGIFAPNRRDGNDRVRSVGPGSVIGEMAYLGQTKRAAEVRVELASVVYRLKGADIDRLRHQNPDLAGLLAFVLGRAVSEKLAQTNRFMANLRLRDAD